jgi:U4/U6 small nuclear ribonucleoprotein PRP3
VGVKEEKVNPYLSTEGEDESRVKGRNMHRSLQFHKPGRHVREAEEARREAQMEALKKRISESAKKAGMEELSAEERALRRNLPPEVEWWDQALLPGKTYEAIEVVLGKGKEREKEQGVLIEGEGTPIDIYVQHPIPIPPPSDKIKVEARGVMLTKKEMKKMRRQRRLADQEDKRDKIKMGLLPPDPPKVKLSNLMKVLTSEAVADPTKVEARVRREVAARKEIHEKTNLDNQLTPEQRKAKIDEKKVKDASQGIYTLVFKIRHLASPSHKFKVRKNALQLGLTGMAIFEKSFALVVVEGGQKSIKAYRRLMTVRIDWNDPGRPKADSLEDLQDLEAAVGGAASSSASPGTIPGTISKEQEEIENIDWSGNYCKIIFEGPVRENHFRFGFKAHYCDHESGAKEALGPKLASFWDLAKRFDSAHEAS